jgi:hypothetical protein
LKKKKDYRTMRILENSFNPEASTVLQNIEQGREILFEKANIALFSGTVINEEPSNLMKHGIMMIQKLEEIGKMPSKRSFVIWISNKFGRSLRKIIFQRIE